MKLGRWTLLLFSLPLLFPSFDRFIFHDAHAICKKLKVGGFDLISNFEKIEDQFLIDLLKNDPSVLYTIRKEDGASLLWIAASLGLERKVKILLEAGIPAVWGKNSGVTPFHAAAAANNVGVMNQLADQGDFLNLQTQNGSTPLILAVKNGSEAAVRWLLERNVLVNLADLNGATPLAIASAAGRDAIVNLLLANKAKIYQADTNRETPLYLARRHNHPKTYRMIRAAASLQKWVETRVDPIECPICFENLPEIHDEIQMIDSRIYVTRCGHEFHKHCYEEAQIKNRDLGCPICRAKQESPINSVQK